MTLLDYCEVGLPYWSVLARCEVLARKQISTIDETIMRAVMLGVDEVSELELFLGLDETALESAIVGLVADERIQSTSEDHLELTEIGQGVLAAAVEIVSREQVIPFDYDGLLRRPILVDELIEPRRLRERGLREVPPVPRAPTRRQRAAVLSPGDHPTASSSRRRARPGEPVARYPRIRSPRSDVSPRRRDAVRPYRDPRPDRDCLCGRRRLSDRTRGGVRQRRPAGPARDRAKAPSGTPPSAPPPRPTAIRERVDIDAEAAAREHVREARIAAVSVDDDKTRAQLAQARRALAAISPRTTQAHEHAELYIALVASRQRLLIAGGPVSDAHIDSGFVRRLRELKKGTCVRIVFDGGIERQSRGLEQLRALARDYPALVLDEQPETKKEQGPSER